MDITDFKHNEELEKIVKLVSKQIQVEDKDFIRLLVINGFNKIISSMRANISSVIYGNIPINSYIIALAPSGFGKNYTINCVNDLLLSKFKNEFIENTLPTISKKNIEITANKNSLEYDLDVEEEVERLTTEYENSGEYIMSFDSGTIPGIKQLRLKTLIAGAGSLNLEIDEIGSNLLNSKELLGLFLELFDKGLTKPKVLKNTKENPRNKDIDKSSPANLLMFGTPVKLLDGSKTEDEFYELLDTGYARRCLFASASKYASSNKEKSAEDIYEDLVGNNWSSIKEIISEEYKKFAYIHHFNKEFILGKEETIFLLKYKNFCQSRAEKLKEFDETKKTELLHRSFKVLKLAGTFAFVDILKNNVISLNPEVKNTYGKITIDNIKSAILIGESSGKSLSKILHREKNYVKLAKFFIQSVEDSYTHADLSEKFSFYKQSNRKELLELAQAWGFKNGILLKRETINNIEFMSGGLLETTNENKLIISISKQITENYLNKEFSLNQLAEDVFTLPNRNWVNHHLENGYRNNESIIKGFNLLVLDVDGFENKPDLDEENNKLNNVKIDFVREFFKDYKYIIYTTKRHSSEFHRFRVVLPINYKLFLNKEEFKEFIDLFKKSLPFNIDKQTSDRCRKWLTNGKSSLQDKKLFEIYYNKEGELYDITNYIPNTDKAITTKLKLNSIAGLSNFENWIIREGSNGLGRNNALTRYGFNLVDRGYDYTTICENIYSLNKKFPTPLSEKEIDSTILISIYNKFKR